MEIAKVNNSGVIEFGHYSNFKTLHGNPSKEAVLDGGYIECNRHRDHNPLTQKLVDCAPVIEGDWCYLVEVAELSEDEIEGQKQAALAVIRSVRNSILRDTEFTQLPDFSGSTEAWANYRQELKDLPSTCGDPRTFVNWPTPPQ